ncbi:MAG: HipA N-terminal domain-containing protein [Candidatus Cloacimonetes bacterium]|jgi:serine/threonine-protein kinase HipA|nr:HipA N-terminal domain-containing protein [Candidatus Cloacimonadota bacterium]
MALKGRVSQNGRFAGIIEKTGDEYIFTYNDEFLRNPATKAISLTLPKTQKKYISSFLFSFFYGLLAEGNLKDIQCRKLKIDPDDYFTRLLKNTNGNVIGNITIEEINE